MKAETAETSRIFSIRVPARLERQLEAIALRDAQTVSATVRRLICAGLRTEVEIERRG